MTNGEQAQAWNGDEGRHWVAERERYERMQKRLSERLAQAAGVQADHAVLDVGCGTGSSTRAAARAAVSWQQAVDNEFLALPVGTIAAHVPPPEPPVGDDLPGPFSLADPDRVRALLTGAGLSDVTVEDVREQMWTGGDVDDVLAFYSRMPFAQSMISAAPDEETVEAAYADLRSALAPHQGPGGVELGSAACLVTARR